MQPVPGLLLDWLEIVMAASLDLLMMHSTTSN